MNELQEIKDRLSIEDLVSQYVQLKKTGRNLKGLCPFHNEKTPSFVVSPDRQIAYCFGCNKGGDIFKFIQEMEGMEFLDALKILAEKTGVELSDYKSSSKPKVTGGEKGKMRDAHEKATLFYENQLWNTDPGAKVLEYLKKRGLTDESIKKFRIGFSPDSYKETYTHLLKAGFTKKLLVSSGLALSKETTVNKIYDRFRGRLMFPVFDNLGRVIAFGGRALSKDQEPKYLNSPESSIYYKSSVLYGFYQSKSALKKKKEAVIAEGYFDVIAAFQAGVTNTVASCGTALAPRQLRLLKPFVKSLALAFDSDIAGQDAAKRAFELSKEFDFGVKMVVIPDEKDPADYVRDHGAKFIDLVKAAEPYGDYYYKKLFEIYGTEDISAKKKILEEFLPLFNFISSSIERDEYVRKLALDLNLKEVQIYDEIKNFRLPNYHPARRHSSLDEKSSGEVTKKGAPEVLLGLLTEFPRMGKLFLKEIDENYFSEDLKPIYKAIADKYNDEGFDFGQGFIDELSHEINEKGALLALYVAEKYGEISEMDIEKEIKALLSSIKRKYFDAKRRKLQQELAEAEKSKNEKLKNKLLEELNRLNVEA
jgi:DNA primase